MRRLIPLIFVAFLPTACALLNTSEDARGAAVRCVRVIDGDTIEVDAPHLLAPDRVRLLRIDTPERGEPGWAEARNALADLVKGREVVLEWEEGQPTRGRYGRVLAYVWLGDTLVNAEMVRLGHSLPWDKYGRGRYWTRICASSR